MIKTTMANWAITNMRKMQTQERAMTEATPLRRSDFPAALNFGPRKAATNRWSSCKGYRGESRHAIRLVRRLWLLLLGCAFHGYGQGLPEPNLVMYGRVLNIRSNVNLRLAYGTLSCTFQPTGGGSPIAATTQLQTSTTSFPIFSIFPAKRR